MTMDWSDLRAAAVCGLILWQQVQIFRLKARLDIHSAVIRKIIEHVNQEPLEKTVERALLRKVEP